MLSKTSNHWRYRQLSIYEGNFIKLIIKRSSRSWFNPTRAVITDILFYIIGFIIKLYRKNTMVFLFIDYAINIF